MKPYRSDHSSYIKGFINSIEKEFIPVEGAVREANATASLYFLLFGIFRDP